MQKKNLSILFVLGLGMVIFLSLPGCKKDNEKQGGYTFTTAVHNTLNEAVILVYGGKTYRQDGKDTLSFSRDSIRILPDSTYSITYFVCTNNCPLVFEQPAIPGVIKMIGGNKEKIDTACGFPLLRGSNAVFDCTKDIKNYYNNQFWQETKNSKGNIVRREYAIDSKDLQEMK
ncbi:hypothetical protein [Arachidicoccus sp.]|jgi:hypothetical protein|uniref:hypothetical protein n=1 Tax=Arachidicoccus sp. TaxID=1872624 RepID=UPI003D19F7E4